MKFKTRMIVTFSALITAAFAVLMSLVYLTVSHANQQLVSSTSVQLFDAKAREAGDWLAQRVSELEIIALSPAVQSMDLIASGRLSKRSTPTSAALWQSMGHLRHRHARWSAGWPRIRRSTYPVAIILNVQ